MSLPKKLNTNYRYRPSGAFDSYVSIINPNPGNDDTGNPLLPTTVVQTWANVSIWRGKEVDKNQERVGQTSYKIVLRYPTTYSIDTGCTVQHGNQLHQIESIADPDGRRVELHLFTWVSDDSVVGVTI
jgi:head-tail adaptor